LFHGCIRAVLRVRRAGPVAAFVMHNSREASRSESDVRVRDALRDAVRRALVCWDAVGDAPGPELRAAAMRHAPVAVRRAVHTLRRIGYRITMR
jgi:hypothetical protein